MIPYFEQPAWQVGPVTVYAFGVAVAVAIWAGLTVTERRFGRSGLDTGVGNRLAIWMVVGGLLGAHLFSVLLYVPDKLAADPWLLLRFWEDISSFGGILGGVIGGFMYLQLRRPALGPRSRLAYFDCIAFAFPGALAVGRLGCALAHDHPGGVTTFPLGISLETEAAQTYIGDLYAAAGSTLPVGFESMAFHDLGFYEFLFLSLVVTPAFIYWGRSPRPPGFFLAAFAILYLPVRFGLDLLRISDVRYISLTPAQWVAALILAALPFAVVRRRGLRLALTGLVIVLTASACWAG